jgi:hypothetical protein
LKLNCQLPTATSTSLHSASIVLILRCATGEAQRRGGGRGGFSVAAAVPEDFDGSWQFCRVAFRQNRNGDGGGWSVDYPARRHQHVDPPLGADQDDGRFRRPEDPKHVVIRLTDPTLFQCPFIMMTEVGAAYHGDDEAEALRNYLLKGGFLWADDFWGEYAWEAWAEQIRQGVAAGAVSAEGSAEGSSAVPIGLRDRHGVPQIASIGSGWAAAAARRSATRTAPSRTRAAIVDQQGRIMVLMTHNTDIGDSWEEEASNPQYFYEFSTKGYAFGIDAIVYA